MILTPQDLLNILKNRPNKDLIEAAQKYSGKLRMHLYGIGLEQAIERMEYFEKPELANVRKKYAKSNKGMFARLHRPIDKVWTARGGSAYYYMPQEQEQQFRSRLNVVEYGHTLRDWMNAFWRHAYHSEPMGLMFMEVDNDGDCYPTFKSIFEVFDYQNEGRDLEYVVFTLDEKSPLLKDVKIDKDFKYFRVVDDAFDSIVKYDAKQETVEAIDVMPNYFLEVPALIASDLYDNNKGMYISPDDAVLEDADTYLVDGSVYSVFKRRFGFPIQWRYQAACNNCGGNKTIGGSTCIACGGTGIKSSQDVSEVINAPIPQQGDPVLAPALAGYITPDIKGVEMMREESALLFDVMHQTYWGTRQRDEGVSNETATGRFIDVQPVNERLTKFSTAAEKVESWITDQMGTFFYPQTYKGCSVNYGKRYLIETPDAIWVKYRDARKIGASVVALDKLLEEYYQATYQADNTELQKHLKLMKIEPLVHYSLVECAQSGLYTDGEEYLKKLYFGDWVGTKKVPDLLLQTVEELRKDLAAYVKSLNVTAALPMASSGQLGDNGQNTDAGVKNHGQMAQAKNNLKTDTMKQTPHPTA